MSRLDSTPRRDDSLAPDTPGVAGYTDFEKMLPGLAIALRIPIADVHVVRYAVENAMGHLFAKVDLVEEGGVEFPDTNTDKRFSLSGAAVVEPVKSGAGVIPQRPVDMDRYQYKIPNRRKTVVNRRSALLNVLEPSSQKQITLTVSVLKYENQRYLHVEQTRFNMGSLLWSQRIS